MVVCGTLHRVPYTSIPLTFVKEYQRHIDFHPLGFPRYPPVCATVTIVVTKRNVLVMLPLLCMLRCGDCGKQIWRRENLAGNSV